jgi:hypothetical protein
VLLLSGEMIARFRLKSVEPDRGGFGTPRKEGFDGTALIRNW